MANWPQNLTFCNFDLQFAQNLALFAPFLASISYLCLAKCSFGIVSFVPPFFSPFMDLHCSNWKIGLKVDDFVFFTSILPNVCPFLQFSERPQPIYASQSTFCALFRLYNHFFSPFMDLQCCKWQISLKIEDFVFWTSILHTIWPFLHLFEPPYPIYGLQSAVLVLFHLHNHFFIPFMDLQYSNWKIGLKVYDFVSLTSSLP